MCLRPVRSCCRRCSLGYVFLPGVTPSDGVCRLADLYAVSLAFRAIVADDLGTRFGGGCSCCGGWASRCGAVGADLRADPLCARRGPPAAGRRGAGGDTVVEARGDKVLAEALPSPFRVMEPAGRPRGAYARAATWWLSLAGRIPASWLLIQAGAADR